MFNNKNYAIMLLKKKLQNKSPFGVTKKGNLKVMRNGKSMDKCAMSFFFDAYNYYAIYWDTANKNEMIKAFWKIWNKAIEA